MRHSPPSAAASLHPAVMPWDRPGAVFHPSSDLIENDWLHGSWTVAHLTGAPRCFGQTRVVRQFNDKCMLTVVEIFHDDETVPCRTISLDHDAAGRVIEFFEESAGGRQRIGYSYNRRGDVVQEYSTVRQGRNDPARVQIASLNYDAVGRLCRVVVRDRRGRILESRLLNANGSVAKAQRYNDAGQIVAVEVAIDDAGKNLYTVEEVRFAFHPPSRSMRAEWRLTDRSETDPHGRLLRREIVNERNRGLEDQVSWCLVARETVQYDGSSDRPLSDRSDFFNHWSGAPVSEAVFRIDVHYVYDLENRLSVSLTRERNLLLGTAVLRSTLHDYQTEGQTSLATPLDPRDHLVRHEYRRDGQLRSRRVFEGPTYRETHAVVYE